ncbi:hypothetical protein LWI28_021489 [Acer negundo]|uniref:Uncharacterized protein n=1 Tax=Acer negundo TaxID=4023 RepID=A0AAD5P3T6_ACENE|nr:hypothetical protein LWI28_021489 [Acer negundo]
MAHERHKTAVEKVTGRFRLLRVDNQVHIIVEMEIEVRAFDSRSSTLGLKGLFYSKAKMKGRELGRRWGNGRCGLEMGSKRIMA